METVKQLQKKYGSMAMFIAIVLALALIMLGYKEMAKGLMLGSIFSVVNFVLMGESLQSRLGNPGRSGTMSFFSLMLARFGLMAVPLVVSIRYDQYHIVATIAGLFMVQAVILTDAAKRMMFSRQL
ncbi:MAG: ATP synthase subunit I [Desulfobacteraceae bacterium]|jgi:hypothetical protein|nr:MAG: ATP synthase subunit I [Desulfobacteraceae bacterium]